MLNIILFHKQSASLVLHEAKNLNFLDVIAIRQTVYNLANAKENVKFIGSRENYLKCLRR